MSGRAVQRKDPKYKIETVSKVYKNACDDNGKNYFETENWELPASDTSLDSYEIVDWVGSGKYSDVFTAYRNEDYTKLVAIKVMKPVRPQKYSREAKILLNLRGCENIVDLIEIVKNPDTQAYSFVFEYIHEEKYSKLFKTISMPDIKCYLYQLLKALDYSHSHGIMHRDVKPLNILFDKETKVLKLIDWGLADFYHPHKRYGIYVASRNYKPIEILVDYQYYDYSFDMWSFGVTMAGMIFHSTPFFSGNTDMKMITVIVECLGSKDFEDYLSKYGIPCPSQVADKVKNKPKKQWTEFINETNKEFATPEALDLIDKCIRYDHQERITAKEALEHPFFKNVSI
ncbi:CMGC family protein kinase [Histomonas meleagridis]|uniref:CMGC family protein kinase n=1 Tax=Histomonas meleagridis TaxID=135588 RepID=UPI003559D617|nr:CMGC family protein kinase [Histomonas meleagridis]KAH0804444.1 CMGC family protein kinase [Histomonas meleagridis]